jgi:hypothetical protein
MNKKKCKTGECSANKDSKPNKQTNGKGDSPRNISKRFKENYENINWEIRPTSNRKKKNL